YLGRCGTSRQIDHRPKDIRSRPQDMSATIGVASLCNHARCIGARSDVRDAFPLQAAFTYAGWAAHAHHNRVAFIDGAAEGAEDLREFRISSDKRSPAGSIPGVLGERLARDGRTISPQTKLETSASEFR